MWFSASGVARSRLGCQRYRVTGAGSAGVLSIREPWDAGGQLMELVHEMTYHAMLRPPMAIGDGPFGSRMFFDVIEGSVEGPRIRVSSEEGEAIGSCSEPTV